MQRTTSGVTRPYRARIKAITTACSATAWGVDGRIYRLFSWEQRHARADAAHGRSASRWGMAALHRRR